MSAPAAPFPCPVMVDLPNWVGDVVLALPVVDRLQRANLGGETVALAPAAIVPLLRAAGVESEPRPDRAGFWWSREQQRRRFTVAITTRHSLRAKAIVAATGAARRLASRGRGARLLGLEVFAVDRGRHQRHDFDAALLRLGVPAVAAASPPLNLLPDVVREGRRWYRRLAGGTRVVALLPACRARTDKRYPEEGYAEVATRLRRDGMTVVVVVGPGEESVASVVAGAGAAQLPTTLPLDVVGAFLASCAVVVGNDSGLTHLAAAAGSRVVALFGPTDPHRTAPSGAVEVIVGTGGRLDLSSLPPELVRAAVIKAIGRGCAGR